jgi:hypothetical protein
LAARPAGYRPRTAPPPAGSCSPFPDGPLSPLRSAAATIPVAQAPPPAVVCLGSRRLPSRRGTTSPCLRQRLGVLSTGGRFQVSISRRFGCPPRPVRKNLRTQGGAFGSRTRGLVSRRLAHRRFAQSPGFPWTSRGKGAGRSLNALADSSLIDIETHQVQLGPGGTGRGGSHQGKDNRRGRDHAGSKCGDALDCAARRRPGYQDLLKDLAKASGITTPTPRSWRAWTASGRRRALSRGIDSQPTIASRERERQSRQGKLGAARCRPSCAVAAGGVASTLDEMMMVPLSELSRTLSLVSRPVNA